MRFKRENLNKKRNYAQFHLELGQSNFLLHGCSTCGLKYSSGDEADEKNHTVFHKNFTLGIQFKVQEVVKMMETELVEGWIFHKHCKVYLFVSSQRIAGCLVAEQIKEAFEVLSCSVGERHDCATARKARLSSGKLQFGDFFCRGKSLKEHLRGVKRKPDRSNSV
ncbi:Protein CHROMOSOME TRANSMISSION FIDELITY 7 [Hibiscus syriacus]|uniref:Protein CHROMOSOME TRANSMISSION FIDELITY 7 n=1 Tax=Hibiscus syriacus TaxID=106335 RepID=A0A6A2YGS8_HIBSY|nr:Protein CHROMOSOME TRANSMISSION FIDELITY 7 [Hibiscus syriacus]